jgi:mono/diheme cytochrome c family protein
MLSTVALVVAGLSTANKIGLATVGFLFVAFALISSFVLPRRNPDFPGKHLGWFVVVCVVFFVAMISAVIYFDREPSEAAGAGAATTTTTTTTTPSTTTAPAATTTAPAATTTAPTTTATASQGDPTAGKAVFASAGCGGCHTLKAAGSTGTVGPNLDQLKPPLDRIVVQVDNGGGPMPAFKGQLTDKQIQDVAAFVYASTHSS